MEKGKVITSRSPENGLCQGISAIPGGILRFTFPVDLNSLGSGRPLSMHGLNRARWYIIILTCLGTPHTRYFWSAILALMKGGTSFVSSFSP